MSMKQEAHTVYGWEDVTRCDKPDVECKWRYRDGECSYSRGCYAVEIRASNAHRSEQGKDGGRL
jgi:phage-related protein